MMKDLKNVFSDDNQVTDTHISRSASEGFINLHLSGGATATD